MSAKMMHTLLELDEMPDRDDAFEAGIAVDEVDMTQPQGVGRVDEVGLHTAKEFSLSAAGTFGAVGSGEEGADVYLVDLENKSHFQLKSDKLERSYSPCFINGEAHFLAVGGWSADVEIWDVQKKAALRVLQIDDGLAYIPCVASTNNILAAGSSRENLYLFHSLEAGTRPQSLLLTADAKYLTIGGYGGYEHDFCVVLSIQ